jgi:hypothetical protein
MSRIRARLNHAAGMFAAGKPHLNQVMEISEQDLQLSEQEL